VRFDYEFLALTVARSSLSRVEIWFRHLWEAPYFRSTPRADIGLRRRICQNVRKADEAARACYQ
jgi:hypothetical protein